VTHTHSRESNSQLLPTSQRGAWAAERARTSRARMHARMHARTHRDVVCLSESLDDPSTVLRQDEVLCNEPTPPKPYEQHPLVSQHSTRAHRRGCTRHHCRKSAVGCVCWFVCVQPHGGESWRKHTSISFNQSSLLMMRHPCAVWLALTAVAGIDKRVRSQLGTV
jgi:hypothetical protein